MSAVSFVAERMTIASYRSMISARSLSASTSTSKSWRDRLADQHPLRHATRVCS
jgi:hypothetical protein